MKWIVAMIKASVQRTSPSPRREWIEIGICDIIMLDKYMSPSPRREWIEIYVKAGTIDTSDTSPSPRREWIEIGIQQATLEANMSPSPRREWIEMLHGLLISAAEAAVSLPCLLNTSPSPRDRG